MCSGGQSFRNLSTPPKKDGHRNSNFEVQTANQGLYENILSVSAAANEGAVMIPPEHLGAYPNPSLVLLCYAKLSLQPKQPEQ
jgi:hypothetical protein